MAGDRKIYMGSGNYNESIQGYFHRWIDNTKASGKTKVWWNDKGNSTVALVEDENGKMWKILAEYTRFVNPPDEYALEIYQKELDVRIQKAVEKQ